MVIRQAAVDGLYMPTEGREPVDSGSVILTNNVNTITSGSIVNVDYAVINIHQNMSVVNSEVSACIGQAFCDFNQACGAQYLLDNTEYSGTVISDDDTNTIGFVSNDESFTVPGQTFYTGLLACQDSNGSFRAFVDEMDIRLN